MRVSTEYGYDSATGELVSVNYSDSTPDVTLTYDRLGRQATVVDGTGARAFAYDGDSLQLETETLPSGYFGGRILTYTYQGTGSGLVPGRTGGYLLGTSGTPDQDLGVSYGYDAQGRMETVTSGAGVFTYGYVSDSDLLAGVEGPVVTAAYTYEPNRDLRTEVHNNVGETTISRYTYRYDTIGRRRDRVQAGEAFVQTTYDKFSYNDRNEVIGSKNFEGDNPTATGDTEVTALARAFTYDPIGNRLSSKESAASTRAYTANALNQYSALTHPSASPTHDLDGNQTISGSGWYYEWDGENRLVLARDYSSSPTSGSKKIEFTYDYRSRRVRKASSEYSGSAWVVEDDRKFVYQGWILLGEFETSGFTRINAYTWGLDLSQTTSGAGGVGGLLAVVNGSDDFYLCFDANGNVSEYVDGSGDIEGSFIYDAFGQTMSETGSGLERFAHRFSSKYFDQGSALYYYGYRYYDPAAGRWKNRDPIEEKGGVGLYGFVANFPTGLVDYMGLAASIRLVQDMSYEGPNLHPLIRGGVFLRDSEIEVMCIDGVLRISGKAQVEMYIRPEGHWLFNTESGRYKKLQMGKIWNPNLERESTILHELDHFKTYAAAIGILEVLNGKEGGCCTVDRASRLQTAIRQIFQEAYEHSNNFDLKEFWGGEVYEKRPFVPKTKLE